MKTTTLTLLLLLNITNGIAHDNNKKLSTWLKERIEVSKEKTELVRRANEEEDFLTTVFVRTSETLTQELLQEYGATIYAQLGDIAIITIPMSQIGKLSDEPSVLRIEANGRAHLTLDTVATVSNILPVYETTVSHPAFTGKDVVVGVMDVGFDLTHPTFYNDASLSEYRIKAFWDQLAPNENKSHLPVGNEFIGATAILERQYAVDGKVQGHGTHTAGIAAGSGYNTPYRGIAFESDICLVANAVTSDTAFIDAKDYYKYTSASDALGFKYLFDFAEQQGKPCVASFSEGYTPYMDDEDLLYNDFLERLQGPGRILVVSAGNESNSLTYIEKPIGTEAAGAFLKTSQKQATYRVKSDGDMTLRLYGYAEEGETPTHQIEINTAAFEDQSLLTDTLVMGTDSLAATLTRYPSAFDEQGHIYLLALMGNQTINKLPPIAIVAAGSERHVELLGNSSASFTNLNIDAQWNAAQRGHNVLGPGCFTAPICVGSTTHRRYFHHYSGQWVENAYSNEQAGLWSPFSSMGPSLDGRTKPEVTAPGRNITSSFNSFYLEANPTKTGSVVEYSDVNERNYPWKADSGTSMSCPVVAGVIALWLQAKPDLTRNEIVNIMERTCRHPEEELTYPNNKYGYGEIDAYAGLLDILSMTDIKEISHHEPQDATIWAQDGMLHIKFDKTSDKPLTVSIYATSGACIYKTDISANQPNVTLPLPIISKGIYVVQLGNLGSTLIRI